MLVDNETFVPGQVVNRAKSVTIKFTKENLARDWTNAHGCPIFCALKDAGVPVSFVKPWYWVSTGVSGAKTVHGFSRELQTASDLLCSTHSSWFRNAIRRWKLEGKEFVVQL